MKSKVLLFLMLVAVSLLATSCASSKAGCKMSQNFVGYGSRR